VVGGELGALARFETGEAAEREGDLVERERPDQRGGRLDDSLADRLGQGSVQFLPFARVRAAVDGLAPCSGDGPISSVIDNPCTFCR
jgi:hypothetical protein